MDLLSCFFRDARSESLTDDEKLSAKDELLKFLRVNKLAAAHAYAYVRTPSATPSRR
ncbi:MAG TPA: hypothetical protein VHA78_00080 [Candidatus Peribacteraceae bacterium]|nr:hypothetical protein [Candidatus Peribacteraceae bacterium]